MSNIEKIARVTKFTGHQGDPFKLLEIDDWSKITPKQLQHYIDKNYMIDWILGYDVGPTPLTNALMQDASPEIINILIANGANVNVPTVLPNGKKMTPLQIVRSKEPTHENVQNELLLLRAGAKDDIIAWLRKHKKELCNPGQEYNDLSWMFRKGYCLRKNLHFLGLYNGDKVFECGPSFFYVMEHAGKIWVDIDFDIYDKGLRLNHFSGPEPEWLNNELGNKFAKEFFAICEQVSFNVAMYEYYMYLSSVYLSNNNKTWYERINSAARELRDKYFSCNDWDELIKITPNITAKAEYSKMKKKRFPETQK